jgi:acyl transferase domain-containing protein
VDSPRSPCNWWGTDQCSWFQAQEPNAPHVRGYFIDEIWVPAERFRIPPIELEEMLPQQVLMLMAAAEAIADSRWNQDRLLQTGVMIGLGLDLNTTNFHFRWWLLNRARVWNQEQSLDLTPKELDEWIDQLRDAAGPPLTANRTMGALGGVVASRVAREFHIGGPSFTISNEENSGLRALTVATRLLQQWELDQALVGAVDLPGDIRSALTSETRDQPLGEGAVAVVLKRLEDAQRDGDRIYAVIKGIGSASDGEIPPAKLETEMNRLAREQALADAGLKAHDIDFLESDVTDDLGHCGAAHGLACLVKSSLCIYQGIFPHGHSPIRDQLSPRDSATGPRRAVIACQGMDGCCMSIVLEWVGQICVERVTKERPQTTHRIKVPVGGKPFQIPLAPVEKKAKDSRMLKAAVKGGVGVPDLVSPTRLGLPKRLVAPLAATQSAKAVAHEAFLRFSQNLAQPYPALL